MQFMQCIRSFVWQIGHCSSSSCDTLNPPSNTSRISILGLRVVDAGADADADEAADGAADEAADEDADEDADEIGLTCEE